MTNSNYTYDMLSEIKTNKTPFSLLFFLLFFAIFFIFLPLFTTFWIFLSTFVPVCVLSGRWLAGCTIQGSAKSWQARLNAKMIKDRPFLNWERQFMAPHEYVIARYARLLCKTPIMFFVARWKTRAHVCSFPKLA